MFQEKASLIISAALALLMAPVGLAQAQQGIEATSCVRSFGSFTCVTRWVQAVDPNIRHAPPRDEVVTRDQQWLARCRPVIRADGYGVGRYRYAVPGCEYGDLSE